MALRSPFGRFRNGLPQVARIYLAGLDRAASADPGWVADFARHTLIVLHHNQLDHNAEKVAQLRAALCPGQRIAWDLSWCEFPADWNDHPPRSFDHIMGAAVERSGGWLSDTAGRDVVLWPGTRTGNFLHPSYPALWKLAFDAWMVAHSGEITDDDLIFLDCGWDSASWIERTSFVTLDPLGIRHALASLSLDLLSRGTMCEITALLPQRLIVNGGQGIIGKQVGRFFESADDYAPAWIEGRLDEARMFRLFGLGACSVIHMAPERAEWATQLSMRHPSFLVAVGTHGDHSSREWWPGWDRKDWKEGYAL